MTRCVLSSLTVVVWLVALHKYFSSGILSQSISTNDETLTALHFLKQFYSNWISKSSFPQELKPPAIFLALESYVQSQAQEKILYSYKILLQESHFSQHGEEAKSFLQTSVKNIDTYLKTSGMPSPLLTAITKNDLKAVTFLVDSFHFDINVVDEFGWSGLHLAAWLDLDQMASLLLSKGADPYCVTLEGFTAMHIAAMRGFDVVGYAILSYLKNTIGEDVCNYVNITTKQRYRKRKKPNEKGVKLNAIEVALLPPTRRLFVSMMKEFIELECPHNFIDPGLDTQPYCEVDKRSTDSSSSNNDLDEILCLSTKGFRRAYIQPSSSLSNSAIDVWDAADLTPAIFKHEYYSLQRPVLIKGNLSSYMGAWNYLYGSIDNFNTRYGDIITKSGEIPYAESYGGPPRTAERIDTYVQKNFLNDENMFNRIDDEEKDEDLPLLTSDWRDVVARISFDGSFFRSEPHLQQLLKEDFQAPPLFADLCGHRKEDKLRPYIGTHQLSIGPGGSGAPLHSHVVAWNVVFRGTKKWLIFPPGHLQGLDSSLSRSNISDQRYGAFPVSHGWGLNKKINPEVAAFALEHGLAFEVTQTPGDVLVIPSQYGHGTMNLCGTISIAQEFGCLDDHIYNQHRLLTLPVMQPYPPSFDRKSGYMRNLLWFDE